MSVFSILSFEKYKYTKYYFDPKLHTYVSEYNINTEENMEEEMTLVNTI